MIIAQQGNVNHEILLTALDRLPLEVPQFLLLVQEFEPFGLAAFRLVGALHRVSQLAVNELIPQTQHDIGELLRRIG